jgi:serine/threonine-protein kinase
MSPEQVAGRSIDHRSDLYSLGVTAYHLLAGSPPFRGETALSVAVQHLNVPPEALEKVRPDLPIALCELVQKAMDKRPEHRYQSAADLAEDLRKLGVALKTDPAGAAKKGLSSFTVAKPGPTSKRPFAIDQFFEWSGRKHAKVLAGVGVVVLALAAGLGWTARPADPFSLPPGEQLEGVGRESSARAQYNKAIFAGTDDAYEAVRQYFPEDRVWTPRATMRLGLNHLYDGDFAGAEEMFRELQASSDTLTRIDGTAGQVIVAAALNDTMEFKRRMNLLMSELSEDDRSTQEIHSELRRLLEGFRERKELKSQIDLLLGDEAPNSPNSDLVPSSSAPTTPETPDRSTDT